MDSIKKYFPVNTCFDIAGNIIDFDSIRFLTPEEVSIIHLSSIRFFGGHPGIREHGTFISAIERPKMGYYNTIYMLSAAYIESFLINHVFFDGNKRTAFGVVDIFLTLNGWRFKKELKDSDLYNSIINWIKGPDDNSEYLNRFWMIEKYLQDMIEPITKEKENTDVPLT